MAVPSAPILYVTVTSVPIRSEPRSGPETLLDGHERFRGEVKIHHHSACYIS